MAAVLLALGSPLSAWAAGSDGPSAVGLDSTFGDGGRVLVPLSFEGPAKWNAKMAASTPDGGLVLSNGHVLERLTTGGQPDASFGQGGTVVPVQPSQGSFEVDGIAVDSKGRIVAAGTTTLPKESVPSSAGFFANGPLAVRVERYLPDGSLDGSFGANGVVETDFGFPRPRDQNGQPFLERPWVQATGVAVDSQNRVVLTGGAAAGLTFGCAHDWFWNTLTYAGFVARLTEAGAPDPGFGGGDGVAGGLKAEENALAAELAAAPTVGPGGEVAFRPGSAPCPRNPERAGIAQLDGAGSPRLDFGSEGVAPGYFTAVAAEPDGSIVALEQRGRRNGEPLRANVKRLQPDGAPDPSFGQGGSTSLVVRGGWRTALSAIAVDPTGRVLVAGSIATEPSRGKRHRKRPERHQNSLLLERLTPSGRPDGAFGPKGRTTVRFKSLTVGPPTLLLDQQGRTLLVGRYRGREQGAEGLAVARFVSR
jgi:uncharacterized delta-60 repeat protein